MLLRACACAWPSTSRSTRCARTTSSTGITEALKRHKIRPSLLTCEITESTAMEDTRATQETFRRLGELGVHPSIDDFVAPALQASPTRKLPAEG